MPDPTQHGDIRIAGLTLERLARHVAGTDRDDGDVGAVTKLIDWADGGGHQRRLRLTASGATILFANGRPGRTYTLIVQQDGTGSRTVSAWDPAVAYPGGTSPVLTTTPHRADLLIFQCVSSVAGVHYLGRLEQANYVQNDVQAVIRDIQVLSSQIAGTTIPITGLPFAPKLILVLGSGRNDAVDAAGSADFEISFGAATSQSVRRVMSAKSDDNLATSDAYRIAADNAVAYEIDGTAVTGALDVSAFNADGVTLEIDNQFAADRRYTVVLIGGATFQAKIATFAIPSATGNQTVTGVGFTPTGLLLFGGLFSDSQ